MMPTFEGVLHASEPLSDRDTQLYMIDCLSRKRGPPSSSPVSSKARKMVMDAVVVREVTSFPWYTEGCRVESVSEEDSEDEYDEEEEETEEEDEDEEEEEDDVNYSNDEDKYEKDSAQQAVSRRRKPAGKPAQRFIKDVVCNVV
ncbi:hypothetical protein L210DRAFT_246296 [Boletus edulis BED1]|uniref:Uncharacterized protein n=1 Tax=Boletus edulis BED1 TaxID=1328754 RepID=A0AAD4BQQ1_BOLED|nr:hypothetical protein L210DRAFT_246296 [Boletus edulis BED1]